MQEAGPPHTRGRKGRGLPTCMAMGHALGLPGVAFHACTSRAHVHCMHARMSHVFFPLRPFCFPPALAPGDAKDAATPVTSSEEDTEESAEDAQVPESPRQVTDRVVKAASKEAKAADLRARLEADKAKAKGQRKPAEPAGPPKVKAAEPPKKKATEPPSPEPRTPSLDASRPVKEKNPRRRGGHGKAALATRPVCTARRGGCTTRAGAKTGAPRAAGQRRR